MTYSNIDVLIDAKPIFASSSVSFVYNMKDVGLIISSYSYSKQ
jgi:hypothetical protein